MSESPEYNDVEQALNTASAELGAAECHGMFCGVLCASGQLNVEAMANQLLTTADSANAAQREAVGTLGAMLNASVEQLQGEAFDLELMLPADDSPLPDRSLALGLWCQGFVTGLSAGGLTRDTDLQKDANELLLDITNISRTLQDVESMADAEGEEEEAAFAEVEEYVRLGVMYIHEELRALRPDKQVH
ncbi:MAG: UPF0149 family protein [Pseudomonadota bacterium]